MQVSHQDSNLGFIKAFDCIISEVWKDLMDSDDVDVEEELLDECVLAETTPERGSSWEKCPDLKGVFLVDMPV